MKEITGWHVLGGMVFAFGIIIAANLTLAFNAVRTFPGLEVKNSYVASQNFDKDRDAQEALNWDVAAKVTTAGELRLSIEKDGRAIAPEILSATFGRATSVARDQTPEFRFDGTAFVAQVNAGLGNWNLRLVARADDGTEFKQRVIVRAEE